MARGIPHVADMNADFRDGHSPLPLSNTLARRASSGLCYLDAAVRSRPNLRIVTEAFVTRETEAILARLRATRMPFDLRVTARIGSATGPLNAEPDWKALYRAADTALFAAKSAGRDRARSASKAA